MYFPFMFLFHISTGRNDGIEFDSTLGQYSNVIVGVDETIETDTFFFNGLKSLLTEFSNALYVATESSIQIGEIVLELPPGAKKEYYDTYSYFFGSQPVFQIMDLDFFFVKK